jgi:hypothetical protein
MVRSRVRPRILTCFAAAFSLAALTATADAAKIYNRGSGPVKVCVLYTEQHDQGDFGFEDIATTKVTEGCWTIPRNGEANIDVRGAESFYIHAEKLDTHQDYKWQTETTEGWIYPTTFRHSLFLESKNRYGTRKGTGQGEFQVGTQRMNVTPKNGLRPSPPWHRVRMYKLSSASPVVLR